MQEEKNNHRLENNLKNAKEVCGSIYDGTENSFVTLNKPTHSEMIFKPLGDIPSNFTKVMTIDDVIMGHSPADLNWQQYIPQQFVKTHRLIQTQTNNKFTDEAKVLNKKIDFTNREAHKKYLESLLLYPS